MKSWTQIGGWILIGAILGAMLASIVMTAVRAEHDCTPAVCPGHPIPKTAIRKKTETYEAVAKFEIASLIWRREEAMATAEMYEAEIKAAESKARLIEVLGRRDKVRIIQDALGLDTEIEAYKPYICLKSTLQVKHLPLRPDICNCKACQSAVWIDGKWIIPTPTQRQQCGSWVTTQPTTQPTTQSK